MEDFTIRHKKKQVYIWSLLGLVLLIIGIGSLFSEEIDFGFNLGLGLFYLGTGLYYWNMPYLKVKDNTLWLSTQPFRKVNLHEIEKVKQFLDETTIISKGKETLISNQQMSVEDKERFQDFVEQLRINEQEGLFA